MQSKVKRDKYSSYLGFCLQYKFVFIVNFIIYVYIFTCVFILKFTYRTNIRSPRIVMMVKSRKLRSSEHTAGMVMTRHAYTILAGKFIGKWPLDRPRKRQKDNIKMELRKVSCEDTRWTNWLRIMSDGGVRQ
jgi:hypothetical protein